MYPPPHTSIKTVPEMNSLNPPRGTYFCHGKHCPAIGSRTLQLVKNHCVVPLTTRNCGGGIVIPFENPSLHKTVTFFHTLPIFLQVLRSAALACRRGELLGCIIVMR